MDGKSGYFLAGEVTKSSPVRYRERLSKMQISRALRPMLCCQYSQRSTGTRVNPDTGWIREDVEIFKSGKKKLRIQKTKKDRCYVDVASTDFQLCRYNNLPSESAEQNGQTPRHKRQER